MLTASTLAGGKLARSNSTTEFIPYEHENVVEYLFASDASAVIEHTNRVIFLEDDDVASVKEGRKSNNILDFQNFYNWLVLF